MAAPKTGTPGYDRLKAHRIRKAIEQGKHVTEEKKSWLAQYEANKGKPRAATPHVQSATVETNPIEAAATPTPQTAPPPMEVPPLGSASTGAGPSSATDASGAPANPGSDSAGNTGTPASAPSKESAVAGVVEIAAGAWIAGMDALQKMTGAEKRMFSDDFVNKIWKPAAIRLGVKYMPDSMDSDIADIAVVVGPPVVTGVAVFRVSKAKQLATKQAAEQAPAPAAGTPEPPAPHSEPHPSGEDTPNGVLTSKADIRKAKLDLDQFKGKVF